MEIRTLRSFIRVAELGSFSRAAVELRIAQPALSRQVRKLEEELGTDLLYRTGRGVNLTHAGEVLLQSGRQVLTDLDGLVREVQSTQGGVIGSAVIGLPPTVGRVLTIPLARRIAADFPGVNLRIVEGFSGHLLEWLYSGRVDVGVLYAEPNVPVMIAEPLVCEDLMLIGRADQLDGDSDRPVPMAEIAQMPLVVPSPPHSLRLRIDRTAADCGLELRVALEVDALFSMIEAVRQGLGVTILPGCAAQRDIAEGLLTARRIDDPGMSQTLYVATASQRPAAVASRRLARIVREAMLDLADTGLWRRLDAPPG